MALTRLSAKLVRTRKGSDLQKEVDISLRGTDPLTDSVTEGTMDTLLVTNEPGVKELKGKGFIMPAGEYESTRLLRTRGLPSSYEGYTGFELKGQGSTLTKLKHPASRGAGDSVYVDYLKDANISGFSVDNTALGSGTSNKDTRNGQMWIRNSSDSEFSDLRFAGGDALTFCLDACTNIVCKDMKVDYQLRYPVGTGKSPLIVGDYSKQCMYLGGYVKSVSPDGNIKYSGDLADNDQADDTKWAFINLYGLTYEQKPNSNACMWQEGQHAPSNAHFIGMNYINNGIGHGVSEKAVGTDIGCTYRGAQVRAIWNRAEFISIGGHFLENKGVYPGGTGGAGSAPTGGIHNDNAKFTLSIGDYFRDNSADYSDYTGASATHELNSTHFVGSKLTAPIRTSYNSTSRHLCLVNCQMTDAAKVSGGGNNKIHVSIIGCYNLGSLGNFGNGHTDTKMEVIGSTLAAAGSAEPLITQNAKGAITFARSTIRDYQTAVSGNASLVTFDSCTFYSVTFTDADLKAKYINCQFVDCTNSPDLKGLNFATDSAYRPSGFRCTFKAEAGQSYTVPSWIVEARGLYTFTVGGRGSNTQTMKGFIHKTSSAKDGAMVSEFQSSEGAITVSWLRDKTPVFTFRDAGTYSIRVS